MLRLLFADDEHIIRQGLHNAVDWNSHGIEICGEATNGKEALSMILSQKPDIFITDIRMPFLDGIEVAERARMFLPELAVIFLTGYSDLEYLLSAIRIGVSDFLLKPASPSSILAAADKVAAQLKERSDKSTAEITNNILVNENYWLLQNAFIMDFLNGKLSCEAAKKKAPLYGIDLNRLRYTLLVLKVGAETSWSCMQLLSKYFDDYSPQLCQMNDGHGILALMDGGATAEHISRLLKRHQKELSPCCLYPAFAIPSFEGMRSIPSHYQDLCKALSREYLYRHRDPYCVVIQPFDTSDIPIIELELLYSQFSVAIQAGDAHTLQLLIEHLFQLVDIYAPSQATFYAICKRIVSINCFYLRSQERYNLFCQRLGDNNPHIQELRRLIETELFTKPDLHTSMNPVASLAIRYVEAHYQNDISTSDVAAAIHVSASHFCRIFKAAMQKQFIDYLHGYRILQAQRILLNSDCTSQEVAEKVGYNNYKLFQKYFHKLTGCNVRDYRHKMLLSNRP